MSEEVARIIMDLLTMEPAYVNIISPPYDAWEMYEKKVVKTFSCLKRATYLGQQTETLEIEQIYWTEYITFNKIRRLSVQEY
ncbi:6036_t:CDS:2 [Acaulospora morrowiae]|uniref:6036_t:CDS:1 n=1 Tax=Acaulospora morrowiae TaxID=94023 RepID=A0A9N9GFF8_9GLOM|nr:6036_t:CDS:2 [Acaulospora morrowiae]